MTDCDSNGQEWTPVGHVDPLLLAVTQAGRGEINLHQPISEYKKNVRLSEISWKGRATHYVSW